MSESEQHTECENRACWLVLPNVDSGCQQSGDYCEKYNLLYEEYGDIAHACVVEMMHIRGL